LRQRSHFLEPASKTAKSRRPVSLCARAGRTCTRHYDMLHVIFIKLLLWDGSDRGQTDARKRAVCVAGSGERQWGCCGTVVVLGSTGTREVAVVCHIDGGPCCSATRSLSQPITQDETSWCLGATHHRVLVNFVASKFPRVRARLLGGACA
jgi:hypothetical protein